MKSINKKTIVLDTLAGIFLLIGCSMPAYLANKLFFGIYSDSTNNIILILQSVFCFVFFIYIASRVILIGKGKYKKSP